ncbi:hypothetical protein A2W14_01390 [Candidatus Gottesmanbacteria bacterium RBG_16_37_8]|uniref:DUF4325 domain-containing protein n=1 Tax=Candidatus Gottesmanbacteria bacterium RBG_16_37_8 TaxID=1798371 RepID=A0A1F5YTZ3_9BACT|nr:MAG: hypothetical protein A2W14_01390 [Candidatus Gottesmanbacteria bacterium RBG_16_37_8]
MKIIVSKFGQILISHPSGREAYLSAKAYLLPKKMASVEFDFKEVKVLTPSWISECVFLLKKDYPQVKISWLNTQNPSVSESLKMLEE